MKLAAAIFGALGVAGALSPPPESPWYLVIAGDADGYLSPCGCTAPMTGGIRRRATAVHSFAHDARVALIDTGGLGGAPGRQGELKAETAAQTVASLDAVAVHLTERDAALGVGSVNQVASLSQGRLVSTSIAPGSFEGVAAFAQRGPFVVGGASDRPQSIGSALAVSVRSATVAAQELVQRSRQGGKRAVLMFSGDHDAAVRLARAVPQIAVLVYRSGGDPPSKAERVGNTLLVTPGERGKYLVRLTYANGQLGAYAPIKLGPDFKDDPKVDRIYRTYLRRVETAQLLERLPRTPSDPFVGSTTCGSCHAKAAAVWAKSGHSRALATLEHDGHGRDPDCVICHVTGLQFEGGFRDRLSTPSLAAVGCESCHGAGKAHSESPVRFKMPKVGAAACASCHRPDQSPHFDFLTYWKKISH